MKCLIPECGCTEFKKLSKEKFSQVVKCRDCGAEYIHITATNKLEIRRDVEKKLVKGEVEFKEKK